MIVAADRVAVVSCERTPGTDHYGYVVRTAAGVVCRMALAQTIDEMVAACTGAFAVAGLYNRAGAGVAR